jgi:TonB family protein
VARDQVRTQVLLLHSEQKTLDALSAGFDDRYTVHCATSGTEALNTLGDTPIHVIVSARDLPGMSGVEALREAKKRSPETIGILLTGDNDAGLEALVGEKEVFQVVSGAVKSSDLTRLVDNATRQMRLLALAESANDRAANPDEPAEHIVMETSENGSTIISDGTGTHAALDPRKIASAVATGSKTVDVLVVTKDEEFLATIRESTRGMHKVHYANTLAQAEQAISGGTVGVAVVDAAMVGENVEKLTQHLRRKTRRLVNIVAGRRDDGEMLMDLINRGKVYRFLLKPVSPGRARLAIEASVKHHLEAPESAFKGGSAAAATRPQGKTQAKAQAKPPAKAAASATPPPGRKPAAAAPLDPAGQARPERPARPGRAATADSEPTASSGDALGGAFGGDTGFAETMTGLVSNLGKALKKKRDKPAVAPAEQRIEPVIAAPRRSIPPGGISAGLPGSFPGDGGSSFSRGKLIAGAAASLIVFAIIGFFVFGGSDEPAPERALDSNAGAGADPRRGASAGRNASGAELLDEARLARQAGQIYNPLGSNAIELYVDALSALPGDTTVAAELAAVVDEALRMAESALLERRANDAAAALDRVAFADPGNGRLPFLFAQLAQMQLREFIDTGRAALRESRFEDAANSIAAARLLDIADTTEIDTLAQDLAKARSEQRVDDVLARAAQRLEEGRLTAPANDNARYYYELVLSNDPANVLAQQGLSAIASKLVLQARGEIDAGRFSQAETLLADANRLDPASAELADANQALSAARARAATEQQAREAERRVAEQKAEQREANERAEAERRAAVSNEQEAVASTAAGVVETGGEAGVDESSESGSAEQTREEDAADEQNVLLAISDLTRVKYVAPKYPRAAERRNLSGWVDVVFTVKADGTTGDIAVRGAEPGDIFTNAALRAVEKWEFEPIVEGGQVVERQAGVRMMFALE